MQADKAPDEQTRPPRVASRKDVKVAAGEEPTFKNSARPFLRVAVAGNEIANQYAFEPTRQRLSRVGTGCRWMKILLCAMVNYLRRNSTTNL